MTEGNFVDYVKLTIRSGNGGRGSTHLHREKYVAKGGPDGGDGGRGGHVIVRGNKNLWTLYSFKFKKHFIAGHGGDGSKNRSNGAKGEDTIIEVPIGTVVRSSQTREILFEITNENEEQILLEGGLGGRGNCHFKSATIQTPRYAQSGIEGSELDIILELKLLADIGLVGFPNSGKSTLLSVLTAAKPKIADYEFTTLKPNLGILEYRDYRSFTMADIPGIIEGAADGKGLGHYFLRHIERNSVLLFLIPADTISVASDFKILQNELIKYNPELMDKSFAVALTKADLLDDVLKSEYQKQLQKMFKNIPHFIISSVTEYNLKALKEGLWSLLKAENV